MPHKIIAVFKLKPGMADEEISRCQSEESFLNMLKHHQGFLSYEVVKINDDSTLSIQTWETKQHFVQAMSAVSVARSNVVAGREEIAISREAYSGDVVLQSQ